MPCVDRTSTVPLLHHCSSTLFTHVINMSRRHMVRSKRDRGCREPVWVSEHVSHCTATKLFLTDTNTLFQACSGKSNTGTEVSNTMVTLEVLKTATQLYETTVSLQLYGEARPSKDRRQQADYSIAVEVCETIPTRKR